MPELPEVERYRRLAEAALGREVTAVHAPDRWMLRAEPAEVAAAVVGRRLVAARRRGKLLLLDADGGATLGLRFGMTGRLVVDGLPGVDRLLHAPEMLDGRWDRFALRFADGGELRLHDPRRLGSVSVDPDETLLGPDALTVRTADLAAALRSAAPLKARLMDQHALAGVGNLVADEVLWRAALDPTRAASSLDADEQRRLGAQLRTTLRLLLRRGGSHTGDLLPHRRPGGRCPRDGAELARATVGGRTTWWCPAHQR